MGFHYYCPICGTSQLQTNTNCVHCRQTVSLIQSIHDSEYYREKSLELYNDYLHWSDILISEEVSKNPLYNEEMRNYQMPKEEREKILDDIFIKPVREDKNIPKCPTCQSSKIKKISGVKRVVHGYAFGLFSKTARSQFECKNCGYKW